MFERFKKSRGTQSGATSVATRDREAGADAPMDGTSTRDEEMDMTNDRVDDARFERPSPGERDRSVVAGGGEADLAADRKFERDEMARGATGDGDTALDRDRARADLDRDGMDRDGMARGGMAPGAGDTDTMARERDGDDLSPGERDRGVSTGTAAGGAAAAAAAGAAAEHHHDRKVEREGGFDRDRNRAIAEGRTLDRDRDTGRDGIDDRTTAGDRTLAGGRTTAAPDRDLDRDGIDDRAERHGPVMAPAALDTMRARQRDRFGGIQWGSDFFGWLCAIGLASILTAILVGAGVALGLSTSDAGNADTAQQIGLGGGIALLVVLAIAWFCGGYVAGRMARFDGARQGIGVWLWTILAAIIVAGLAAIGGSEYDIFQRLNLPRIAVGDNTLTAGGAIAGAVAIIVTLLFAIIGGKVGERYHRRVDGIATDEYVVER
jgi:hypothetical protein